MLASDSWRTCQQRADALSSPVRGRPRVKVWFALEGGYSFGWPDRHPPGRRPRRVDQAGRRRPRQSTATSGEDQGSRTGPGPSLVETQVGGQGSNRSGLPTRSDSSPTSSDPRRMSSHGDEFGTRRLTVDFIRAWLFDPLVGRAPRWTRTLRILAAPRDCQEGLGPTDRVGGASERLVMRSGPSAAYYVTGSAGQRRLLTREFRHPRAESS